ncbi:MAG: hypothetical protein L3J83_05680 [Proteobacteria bacterium]|nr:hypothetical protein [Pseudomonadota bacterium]
MNRFLLPLLLVSSVFAQTESNTSVPEEGELAEPLQKNNFDNLLPVEEIVLQLQKNYGFKGSVILTKQLGQILSSFSNQEQAQSSWQSTVKMLTEVVQLDGSIGPLVNFQFGSGQILSKYTHGMDLEKWQYNRTGFRVNDSNLFDFLKFNDELTLYLQLDSIWTLLLNDLTGQEDIVWNDVFADSLSLFSETPQTEKTGESQKSSAKIDSTEFYLLEFFEALNKWSQSDNKDEVLIDLSRITRAANYREAKLFTSLLQLVMNKNNQHYLASSIAWFNVVYQLNRHHVELDEESKITVTNLIEENDVWFLSKESELLAINEKLPAKIAATIQQLKLNYQQPLGSEIITGISDLPNVYQLIEPRLDKYMATPFRNKIRKELEVCLNISEEFAPFPQQPIDNKQFNGCIDDLTMAAVIEASSRELSGSLTKIDTKIAIDRALQLPAWQTINILKAGVAQVGCLNEFHQTVNPLEWALATESLLWFIDRWPAYFAMYPNKVSIKKTIKSGEKLLKGLDCLDKPTADLLDIEFSQVEQAWQKVKAQIKQVADEFNQLNLSVGSDINLMTNSEESSNYWINGAIISACDVKNNCGVRISLESSRALFAMFPNHLLVANQLKLGQLKLCYDNVGWENRRSAPTHLDNPSVANYFGNFSFNLKGFYGEQLVFDKKLISKEEHYYLFAENNDEVLSTYCPLSIVGDKISTQLDRGTFGLVPNRLTFLTASRTSGSNILTANWLAGEQWQDSISGDETELIFENDLSELNADTQLAYQNKAQELQALVYQILLNNVSEPTSKQQLLTESIADMYRARKMLAHMVYITQADQYLSDDLLHGIFFGNDKIPDRAAIIELYKNQLNINQLIAVIDENIKNNKNNWNNFNPTWSYAYLKNILYRLSALKAQ